MANRTQDMDSVSQSVTSALGVKSSNPQRCFALMEDLPAREMARRGWVCHHGVIRHSELREKAKAREERECRGQVNAGKCLNI